MIKLKRVHSHARANQSFREEGSPYRWRSFHSDWSRFWLILSKDIGTVSRQLLRHAETRAQRNHWERKAVHTGHRHFIKRHWFRGGSARATLRPFREEGSPYSVRFDSHSVTTKQQNPTYMTHTHREWAFCGSTKSQLTILL